LAGKLKLQVTADDIGAVPSIDRAAQELVELNVVNALSVFVTGGLDLTWLLEKQDSLKLGLHLTFSFGLPRTDLPHKSGLVDVDGKFLSPVESTPVTASLIQARINDFLQTFGYVSGDYLKQEALGQFMAFKQLFGKEPEFINVHQDLDISQNLSSILRELFPKLPSRAAMQKHTESRYFYIFDFLEEGEPYQSSEMRIHSSLERGLMQHSLGMPGEVVFHPAHRSKELCAFSTYSTMREVEYNVLSSVSTRTLLSGQE
jgi:predicted glycoside hydrolase/deacetylase ChbG (UPF0249 family)